MGSVNPLKGARNVSSSEKKRLVLVGVFLASLYSLLVIKFYQIQILEHDKWATLANRQHKKIVYEPFRRGSFYANGSVKKGHPERPQKLVFDVPKVHLFADPSLFSSAQKTCVLQNMAQTFSLSDEAALFAKEQFAKQSRNRKLAAWIDPSLQETFEAWWRSYAKREKLPKNGIYFVKDFKRSYPFGSLLGALLHTVQEQKDPATGQSIPTGGLEMKFDQYLRGKRGKKWIYRSNRRVLSHEKRIQVPENGADIYLTINHYLQAISEKYLEEGVKRCNAKGGWSLLMDPYTGDVLAIAQYPPFDVRNYPKYFADPLMEERTKLKAVTDAFEPGSTFKAITMMMALKANQERSAAKMDTLFSPEEKMPTKIGSFPDTKYRLKDGRTRRHQNMYMAIQKSSNIYVGKLMEKMLTTFGPTWIRESYTEVFGFGKKTGIEVPAEACGQIPTPGRLHPNGTLEWSKPTPYALACGHNILVNSVQMVRAYAMIANGGFFVQPKLIKKIVRQNNGEEEMLYEAPTEKQERRLSKETVEEMKRALRFTTTFGGTSPRADIAGFTEAGKSGTSEKIVGGRYSKTKYISSFCGFAPMDKPAFVLFVVMDEPEKKYIPGVGKNYMGGTCAGPVFAAIGKETLRYLGVSPDDPEKTHWKKETRDLRKLDKEWNFS
ncbi:MAG: penicillin-binding protein 2 [Chlamydiota bacterium]